MKPKMRNLTKTDRYFTFYCRGLRADGHYAYGYGHTMERAYQSWLDFDPSEILF